MGTGWRRAFCTTIPRDSAGTGVLESPTSSPGPTSCVKIGFFSGPSTPRVRSLTAAAGERAPADECPPRLQCKTTTPRDNKSPRPVIAGSNPSSPRTPLKLSLFKNSFKFRSSCGICLNSVKTGQGTAIYTAECSHAFHFPCIASHVRKYGSLICPVCNTTWKDVPLLAVHRSLSPENAPALDKKDVQPKIEEKRVIDSSPRVMTKQPAEVKPNRVDSSRSYDDDEPLLSPRFNPIPEADENAAGEEEDDDVEEFQGFFVNPNPASSFKSDEFPVDSREQRTVQVRLLPETAPISAGRGYETYAVAIRVKAPPPPCKVPVSRSCANPAAALHLDSSHRAPIDLVTVLDVGGSMTGEKLQMLKRAMRLVISSLGSADRLSIVAFAASPKRLLPLRRMTAQGQRSARRIVDRLICGQGSSVGEALRKATRVLEDRRDRNPVASLMLLSDGQDERVQTNSNSQRPGSGHVSSTRFAHIEIPVHAFGFGRSGGYSNEPAEEAFAKCVGGLLSVVVQDLRIQLSLPPGSAPAEIIAVYSSGSRPAVQNSGSVRVGDLYAEEERELLVELRVPAASAVGGARHVMSVRCLYKDPATQEIVYGRAQSLRVPLPLAVRSPEPKMERLRHMFVTTRAVAESRRLIENNDPSSAYHLLASTRALLVQIGSEMAGDYIKVLEAELQWRRQQAQRRKEKESAVAAATDENGEPLTPSSAWRAAEKLAKVAMMNRVGDLHGFENARF